MFKLTTDQLLDVGYVLGGILAALFVYFRTSIANWVKRICSRKKFLPREIVYRTNQINQRLTDTMNHYGADRIYIGNYHNGDHFSPNYKNAIWKITVSHEIVKPGTSRIQKSWQAVLVTNILEFIYPIMTGLLLDNQAGAMFVCGNICDNCYETGNRVRILNPNRHTIIFDSASMNECLLKTQMESNGTNFTVMSNLLDGDENIGFVAMDFCHGSVNMEDLIFKIRQDNTLCKTAGFVQYTLIGAADNK